LAWSRIYIWSHFPELSWSKPCGLEVWLEILRIVQDKLRAAREINDINHKIA